MSLLAIIDKCGILISEWGGLYYVLVAMNKITLWNLFVQMIGEQNERSLLVGEVNYVRLSGIKISVNWLHSHRLTAKTLLKAYILYYHLSSGHIHNFLGDGGGGQLTIPPNFPWYSMSQQRIHINIIGRKSHKGHNANSFDCGCSTIWIL